MADASIDMLLQETILDDSTTASFEGDSIAYQNVLSQSRVDRGKENIVPNHLDRNHSQRHHQVRPYQKSSNDPQSPPSDLSPNDTMDNDETRCSAFDSPSSIGNSQPAKCATRDQPRSSIYLLKASQPSILREDKHAKFSYSPAGEQLSRQHARSYTNSAMHATDNEAPLRDQTTEQHGFYHPPVSLEWRRQKEYDVFRPRFSTLMSNFTSRHRRVSIREYKLMSAREQGLEHERVVSLLNRLGIHVGSQKEIEQNDASNYHPETQGAATFERPDFSQDVMGGSCAGSNTTNLNDTESSFGGHSRLRKLTRNGSAEHSSQPFLVEKLSPIRGDIESYDTSTGSPCPLNRKKGLPPAFAACGTSFQDQSMETARHADSPSRRLSLYESPSLPILDTTSSQPNTNKRLASTSGKRGKDAFRMRYSSDSSDQGFPTPDSHYSQVSDGAGLFLAAEEAHRHPFTASQSPIETSPRAPCDRLFSDNSPSTSSPDDPQNSRKYRDLRQTSFAADDTALGDRYSRKPRWKQVSTNLALKDGVPLRYNPLQIQVKTGKRKEDYRTEPPRLLPVEFRDPLKAFVGEGGQALQHVFEWIRDRDRKHSKRGDKWYSDSKGVIFSLAPVQIVSVIMKLLLDIDGHSRYEERPDWDSESSLTGQTLVVVRSKNDIAIWERALREHTPFSVSSHADLSSSERKHSATAAKCATFDVVLSTFDALKSPDVTIQVDDDDHAILSQGGESQAVGGWMTKRVQGRSQRMQSQGIGSAARCKKLSGLHSVCWRRIVFVDELGKKCFLAKHGTSRASAAVALGGATRYATNAAGPFGTPCSHSSCVGVAFRKFL
jgi:hypothetical protein